MNCGYIVRDIVFGSNDERETKRKIVSFSYMANIPLDDLYQEVAVMAYEPDNPFALRCLWLVNDYKAFCKYVEETQDKLYQNWKDESGDSILSHGNYVTS